MHFTTNDRTTIVTEAAVHHMVAEFGTTEEGAIEYATFRRPEAEVPAYSIEPTNGGYVLLRQGQPVAPIGTLKETLRHLP
jgi:hypothetical protein